MGIGVGIGVVVGVKEKEDGVSNTEANANLLGIGLEPLRTDSGLLLMHRRFSKGKAVAKNVPLGSIIGRYNQDVNRFGVGIRIVGTQPRIMATGVSDGLLGGEKKEEEEGGGGYTTLHSDYHHDPCGCGSPGRVRLNPPRFLVVVIVVVQRGQGWGWVRERVRGRVAQKPMLSGPHPSQSPGRRSLPETEGGGVEGYDGGDGDSRHHSGERRSLLAAPLMDPSPEKWIGGGSRVGSNSYRLRTLLLSLSFSGLSGTTRRLLLDWIDELKVHRKEDPYPTKNGHGGEDGEEEEEK